MKTVLKRDRLSPRKRYRVMRGQVVPVAIQRPDDGQQPASGELMDITVSSARILSQVPLRFGEKFILHLESESVGLSTGISCNVQWIRAGSGKDEWILGCLFESHLETDLLEEYVECGLLERRESDRSNISLPATIKLEVSGEETQVDVSNIGTGGFCYMARTGGTIGARVRLTIDEIDSREVEGRIKWESTNNGEHLVGCQWENRKGRLFARQIEQKVAAEEDELSRKRGQGGQYMIHTLIIAIAAFSLGVWIAS